MATLEWDQVGKRTYQNGLDRGVLYMPDGRVVPWSGLRSLDEEGAITTTPYYVDGVKYLNRQVPGDFSGKLKALTYPDEFEEVMGIVAQEEGFRVHDQPTKSFSLSYRTRIGSDTDARAGYKIHILYDLTAVPEGSSFNSLSDKIDPVEFGWSLSAVPQRVRGYRPTAHFSFNSTQMTPSVVTAVEKILYGDATTAPRLPTAQELIDIVEGLVIVVDNGDGTWTAVIPSERLHEDGQGEFSLEGMDAKFLSDGVYQMQTDI